MKLTFFLSVGILFCTITAFSQNVASTATLTSGGLNAGTSGTRNTFYGYQAGKLTTTGSNNTFIGESGTENKVGSNNVFVGNSSGNVNNGNQNVFIGAESGSVDNNGDENTFLGFGAGRESNGNRNIFIGAHAGHSVSGNDLLYIDIQETDYPLIRGDFAQDQLKFNGKVGIGNGFGNFPTTAGSVNVAAYNLFVKGGILTEEVRVNLQGDWADYVFDKNYKLGTLEEVETFINQNKHLPNMPSAKQVKEEGIELGQMITMQQEKIEELTLYLLQLNKENQKEKEQNKILLKRLSDLEEKVNLLFKK